MEFIQQMLQTHGVPAALTIVFSHLPMWPLATGREQEIIDDPELLALLHGSGVDIYVSGHHHVFYAGTDQHNMIHLGLGALGGNARSFSGSPDRQPHSFATLDIGAQGITVKSYAAPAFNSAVPTGKLPEFIKGPLGTLLRMDGPVRLRAWAEIRRDLPCPNQLLAGHSVPQPSKLRMMDHLGSVLLAPCPVIQKS